MGPVCYFPVKRSLLLPVLPIHQTWILLKTCYNFPKKASEGFHDLRSNLSERPSFGSLLPFRRLSPFFLGSGHISDVVINFRDAIFPLFGLQNSTQILLQNILNMSFQKNKNMAIFDLFPGSTMYKLMNKPKFFTNWLNANSLFPYLLINLHKFTHDELMILIITFVIILEEVVYELLEVEKMLRFKFTANELVYFVAFLRANSEPGWVIAIFAIVHEILTSNISL